MGQHVATRTKSFLSGAALASNRRVRLDAAGKLVYCGADDLDCLGITEFDVFAADEPITITLCTAQGSVEVTVSEAVSAPSTALYAASDGKCATSGTVLVGESMETASGNGSIIEAILSPAAILGAIARTAITQQDLQPYTIPLGDLRTSGTGALLGTSAGTPAGAFGITVGTHGSASPKVVGEAANGASVVDSCRFQFPLPVEYTAGETVTVRVHARITGAVQVAQTLDVEAFKGDKAAGVGSDLCATAAKNLTTSFADHDFVITPTNLAAGDLLDIEITGTANDTGGTANKLIEIGAVQVLLDVKG